MNRTSADGVTVLWAERPGPLAGLLTFGVGTLDEGLDELGCCLAVQTLAGNRTAPAAGAVTFPGGGDTTGFGALGSAEELGRYFTALCEALSAPVAASDLSDVDFDERVTDYLSDPVHADPWAALVARRLRAFDRWPPPPLDAAEVARFRATWFVAANAVLVLTGPPPAGLRLPLPPGPRPARPVRGVTGIAQTWYADAVRGPGLSLVAADPASAYPVVRALSWEIDRALRDAGQPVECFPNAVGFAPDGYLFGLCLDSLTGRPGGDPAAQAEILWSEVRRFAEHGPTPAYQKERARPPALKLPEDILRWQPVFALSEAADRELLGHCVEDDEAPEQTPLELAAVAAALLPSAVAVVPYGAQPVLPGLAETSCWDATYLTPGEEVPVPLLRRRSRPPRLIIRADSVSTVDARGAAHTIPAADLLVISGEDGLWIGHTGHACAIDVSAYKKAGDRLMALAHPRRRRMIP